MHKTDFDNFRALLDNQADVFSKPKPNDNLVASYWSALRDVSFSTVKACAERHARHGKFFPKPFELRPREDKPPAAEDAASKAKFEAAQQFSMEAWQVLKREQPDRYEILWREALLARLEVITPESSPAFERVRQEAYAFAQKKLERSEKRAS